MSSGQQQIQNSPGERVDKMLIGQPKLQASRQTPPEREVRLQVLYPSAVLERGRLQGFRHALYVYTHDHLLHGRSQ